MRTTDSDSDIIPRIIGGSRTRVWGPHGEQSVSL